MIILDSSVWVALFNDDDSQHKKAVKVFSNLKSSPIGLPEYIILEVASVLALRANKAVSVQFIEYALENGSIDVIYSSGLFFNASVGLFKKAKNLSFVDCSLLYLSRNNEIITFDIGLKKAIASR